MENIAGLRDIFYLQVFGRFVEVKYPAASKSLLALSVGFDRVAGANKIAVTVNVIDAGD
jgi:hypothetical protein